LRKKLFAVVVSTCCLLFNNAHAGDFGLDWPALLETAEQCSGGLPKELILSVIWVESEGNPNAINVNGVGGFSPSSLDKALKILYKYNRANTDIGLMQVNWKTWGPKYGLKAKQLFDPVTNICVGSRILRDYIDEHKGSWKGIGRYNAVTYSKQLHYASRVNNVYKKVKAAYQRKADEKAVTIPNQNVTISIAEASNCTQIQTEPSATIVYGPPPLR